MPSLFSKLKSFFGLEKKPSSVRPDAAQEKPKPAQAQNDAPQAQNEKENLPLKIEVEKPTLPAPSTPSVAKENPVLPLEVEKDRAARILSPQEWFKTQAELATKTSDEKGNGESNGVRKNRDGFILTPEAVKKYRSEIRVPGNLRDWREHLGGQISVFSFKGKSVYGLKIPIKHGQEQPDLKPPTPQELLEVGIKETKGKRRKKQLLAPPSE